MSIRLWLAPHLVAGNVNPAGRGMSRPSSQASAAGGLTDTLRGELTRSVKS